MKTVAVVPMKLNNQRLPGKNTKPFTNGRPLCSYILSTLPKVEEIDEVYVYCSDPGIREYIPAGIRFLKRPERLDRDSTKMNEVLGCFARDVPADIYVLAHATAPFISSASIAQGVRAVREGGYDSAFAARKLQDFLWEDGRPFNYDPGDIPRTQDLTPMYVETSGFYIYRAEIMRQLGRRIGMRPFIVEVSEIESIDIDEEEDFMIADAVFNYTVKLLGGGVSGKRF